MIFQEKSVKELLESNLRREGPILEGNEEIKITDPVEKLDDEI